MGKENEHACYSRLDFSTCVEASTVGLLLLDTCDTWSLSFGSEICYWIMAVLNGASHVDLWTSSTGYSRRTGGCLRRWDDGNVRALHAGVSGSNPVGSRSTGFLPARPVEVVDLRYELSDACCRPAKGAGNAGTLPSPAHVYRRDELRSWKTGSKPVADLGVWCDGPLATCHKSVGKTCRNTTVT